MHTARIAPTLESWREEARSLLARRVHPDAVLWCDASDEPPLFLAECSPPPAPEAPVLRVPAAFMDLAHTVAAHKDERRWAVLYRLLWRITHGGERALLNVPTDADVRLAEQWRKSVRGEIHKMHAFVRFRLTGKDEATGREQFVAWFEPEHRVVRLAAPFFEKRFAGMDWSILTPDECVYWDGERLQFTSGESRAQQYVSGIAASQEQARGVKGVKKQHLPEDICVTCGRPFLWRKNWERVWDEVRCCPFKKSAPALSVLALCVIIIAGHWPGR